MSDIIPVTLPQDNLGQLHHQFNSKVKLAYYNNIIFENIQNLEEKSAVDRLFKIDYASKLKDVDYIIKNLKDEDMLYASRALKAKWLLEAKNQHIVNPKYLDDVLYPDMKTQAVSKMKNWLYVNLKDQACCEQFYSFYCIDNFDYAVKFLYNCEINFIMNEMPKIMEKLTPYTFKRLCESCPRVAKIYFDSMPDNEIIKSKVLNNPQGYFNSLKVLLKAEPDIFFEITEKYFKRSLSKSLTKYVMKNHKDRFDNKVELYSSSLLNIAALAECLDPDQCKETVLKLARANYLEHWFSYKNVEPLIKRLSLDERSKFKKYVFVDKNVGVSVDEWPYDIPKLPIQAYSDGHIFDAVSKPYEYTDYMCYDDDDYDNIGMRMVQCCNAVRCEKVKTYLDKLFDEFRFASFGKTLFELSRRIKVESSHQNRQYILLVLVSKCGGHSENLASLLTLLDQHPNEPSNVRAAIVRSLVKRAAVWRLNDDNWESLLKFSRGLGLDGKTPEPECREGLHAVVLRSLLRAEDCEPTVRDAFLREFSDLKEYPTNIDEQKILSTKLPAMLLAAAETEINSEKQAHHLNLVIDTLTTYKVNIETTTLIPAVASVAKLDLSAAANLLKKLYKLKIGRRTLFYENFMLFKNDKSYLNALRHDRSIIKVQECVDYMEKNAQRMKHFLRKIAIYYTETNGLLYNFLTEIKKKVMENTDVKLNLVQSLCLLQGADLEFIRGINTNNKSSKRLSAAIYANMHLGRPKLDISEIGISAIGAKACANKVLVCPKTQIDRYIQELMKWKRTARVTIVLAERIGKEADAFANAAALRPMATLKAAIKYFRRKGDSFDPRVWEVVKSFVHNIDISLIQRKYLRKLICKVDNIPLKIRSEYCSIFYSLLKNTFHDKAITMLFNLQVSMSDVNESYIEKIILELLEKFKTEGPETSDAKLYIRIIIKYLIVSKSESIQKTKLELFGEPLINCLQELMKSSGSDFVGIFESIVFYLQLNEVCFDEAYVSPLPVIELILSWMHIHLPIEMYFDIYVCVHLTMLYFKAIRQSMAQHPYIFTDKKLKMTDGVDVVGKAFGQFIAQNFKDVMLKYFESIFEIYRNGIDKYFENYFYYGSSKGRFVVAVTSGIVDDCEGAETKIAVYLVLKNYISMDIKYRSEVIEKIKKINNAEAKFFVFAACEELSL